MSHPAQPAVVVVGAGPAGATAARKLALGGARVRLLDRSIFPRHKPCGGAISMRALERFPYLREALPCISTRHISRLLLHSPSGEAVTLRSPSPAALMIRRIEFDELLVRLAQDVGVELVEGVEIAQAARAPSEVRLIAGDGRMFAAPFVVAADGANSVVARRLGMNPGWQSTEVALDMMEETPFEALRCADPDLLWVAYGYQGSPGYAYVFPKRDHVNVGVGYLLSFFRSHVREAPYDVQEQLVRTLCRGGVLAGRSHRRHFTPALIPVGGPVRHTVQDGVLLAGDAGGFVNGFSAEGIFYAMVSGDLAAEAILAGRPAQYARAWRREIGKELRDSISVQRYLFADPARIDRMVQGARRWPELARVVVDHAMGVLPYPRARRRLVWRLPLVAVRLAVDTLRLSIRPESLDRRLQARVDD